MERDRLGRRRSPEQERGLRPLHPLLPEEWVSKALRVAMSESDWAEFETSRAQSRSLAPTQARAYGMVLSGLLHRADSEPSQARSTGWTGSAARRCGSCPTSLRHSGRSTGWTGSGDKTLRLLCLNEGA